MAAARLQRDASVDGVCAWISALGLWESDVLEYCREIRAKGLDGRAVFESSAPQFVQAIGVSIVGHKMLLEKHLGEAGVPLTPAAPPEPTPGPVAPISPPSPTGAAPESSGSPPPPSPPPPQQSAIKEEAARTASPPARAPSSESKSSEPVLDVVPATGAFSLASRMQSPALTRGWSVVKEGCLLKVRKSLGKGLRLLYALLKRDPQSPDACLELYEGQSLRTAIPLGGARIVPSGKAELTIDTKRYACVLRTEQANQAVAMEWVLALQQAALAASEVARRASVVSTMSVDGFVIVGSPSRGSDTALSPSSPPPLSPTSPTLAPPPASATQTTHTAPTAHAAGPAIAIAPAASSIAVTTPTTPATQAPVTASAPDRSEEPVAESAAPTTPTAAAAEQAPAAVSGAAGEEPAGRPTAPTMRSAQKPKSNILKTSYMNALRSQYHFIDEAGSEA